MAGHKIGWAALPLIFAGSLGACAPHQYAGEPVGGAVVGATGTFLEQQTPWRGGVIGAPPGAVAGATISDISVRGAKEAAYAGKPVEYRPENQRVYYYAEPLGSAGAGLCRRVREKTYVDGKLARKRIIVICDQVKYDDPRYRYDPNTDRYEYNE
jgi:hypothetical protein